MPATKPVRPATAADFRTLQVFVAALDALDWREGFERFAPCRRGSRLAQLGWLRLERGSMRSSPSGIMDGQYYPAEWKLTPAGKAAAEQK